MKGTPRGVRLHIGLFGRRNVGKSSLLNALTGQEIAIVSEIPGTTTDIVKKAMELKPIGPVIFLDTAGLDDVGELGEKRIRKTLKAMDRTEIALVITDDGIGDYEKEILQELKKLEIPSVIVFSKIDLKKPDSGSIKLAEELASSVVKTNALEDVGMAELRGAIVKLAPDDFMNPTSILSGIVEPGDTVVLVIPIDLEAPKGRLILPQAQVIREILDYDARAIIVKENELPGTLDMLKINPKIVITDSQAILQVAADVPTDIPVTGFSVLYARWKGDFETFVRGTYAINNLKPGDKVLVAEACTHHPIADDIGREKIPKWLGKFVGGDLEFTHYAGHDFPDDLSEFQLVIMCGSCMLNRREVISRLLKVKDAGVPISNYGLTIAFSLGVFDRMLSPFPDMIADDDG
ncbi:[FeFe] hydrogenase H-cluster maturation GTPase HydF [bacterium]|nr:[FeFe] hydrogenase H-cluster maturation GTPase HydF [bacterium]